MAFVITQPCIDTTDQACVEVCPVDCIHFEQDADRMLYINPAECIDCGACQPACPVQAIFPEGDVPGEMQKFIGINAAWYGDRAAARAQVGGAPAGGAAPAAPRPAAEAPKPAAEEAPAPTAVVAARSSQVSAFEDDHHGTTPIVAKYNQPSPLGVISAFGIIAGAMIAFAVPGPRPVMMGLGGVIALFFLGGFLQSQIRDLALFAASHPRAREGWRHAPTIWRRGEESRRFLQQKAVESLAATRFGFPTVEHPDYRTYVNVPTPTMALEFGGGGTKVYPDILVLQYPGNYPVMVAQVETGETVTRDQAVRVWKQLETEQAPLYIYVPAGYGTVAKDYVKATGIKHAEVRTFARMPEGVGDLVHEV